MSVPRPILPEIINEFFTSEMEVHGKLDNLYELSNSALKKDRNLKKVILITGPSGAGKDTIVNSLPEDKFVRWRTWTTRSEIRKDEEGEDPYVRVNRAEFESEIEKGHFMEFNEYSGNLYGTHKREAEAAFNDGRVPVLRIDPRGAAKFNEFSEKKHNIFQYASLHHFYVIPPTFDELVRRLRNRESDEEIIEKRIESAKNDLPFVVNAQYLVISERGRISEAVAAINFSLGL